MGTTFTDELGDHDGDNPANWSAGLPRSTYTAYIEDVEACNFSQGYACRSLIVRYGSPTITFAGGHWTISEVMRLQSCTVIVTDDMTVDGSVTLRYLTDSNLTKLSVRFTQANDLAIIAGGVPIGEVVWTSAGASYHALISGLDCDVLDVDGNVQFNYAAPVNIRSNLILRPGAVMDMGSGNAILTVQGDVAAGEGPCTWQAGTGGLHFVGTGDQLLDVAGIAGALDPIFIAKPAGQLILQSDLSCVSTDHQAGTLEPNGKSISTTGNCRIYAGTKLAGSLDGSAWSVGGDLDWQGQDGDLLALWGTSPWSLSAMGEVTVRYTDVAFCDASAGTAISALDGTSINSGNNLNWHFPPVQPFSVDTGCVHSTGAHVGIPVVPTAVAGETFVAVAEAAVSVVPTAVAGETFVAAAKKGVVHA